jgi:AraC-like DNA-binding protein
MPTIELVLRVAGFAELSLLILILFLQGKNNRSYHYAAILLLGVASYLLAPLVLHEWHWGLGSYPVIAMAIIVPGLFWYFVSAVLTDNFEPHPGLKWLLLATAAVGMFAFCSGDGTARYCPRVETPYFTWMAAAAKLMWIASAFYLLLKDWNADLVETRRGLRRLIVIVGACYIGVILTVELFIPDPVPTSLEVLNISVLLVGITTLCLHMLGLRETNLFARMAKSGEVPVAQHSDLATRLVAFMAGERAYATEALTINSLARKLETQHYQLRQVINGELGHRNFNAFVNLYRIEEIAERMNQEGFRDAPLLTLALDAGFRSLAPFNRSFKDHFGVTPSDYRQSAKNKNTL